MAGTQVVKTDQTQDEPEIEIVEEGTGVQPGQEVTTTEGGQVGAYDYDEEEGVGHQPGAGGGAATGGQVVGETQEQMTARQRRRRAERAKIDRDRQELQQLRAENQQLRQATQRVDQRLTNVETTTTDNQIATLEAEVARAQSVLGRAISAANGEDAATALEIRDTLRDRLQGLKAQKARLAEEQRQAPGGQASGTSNQTGQQRLPPGITQAQVNNFQIFASRHPWYDPKARDPESQQAKAIDAELQSEGSDPNTAEHWHELEKRIHETMPRYTQAANGGGGANGAGNGAGNGARRQAGPKLPGAGAAASGGGGGNPTKFHISQDRKQALVDLGVWGTPDAQRYIKNFIKYDKEHPTKQ